jgi:cell division protein FtsZ
MGDSVDEGLRAGHRKIAVVGIGAAGTIAAARLARSHRPHILPICICESGAILGSQHHTRLVLVGRRRAAPDGATTFGEAAELIVPACAAHLALVLADLADPSIRDEVPGVVLRVKGVTDVAGIFSQSWDAPGAGALRSDVMMTYSSWTIIPGTSEPADVSLYWAARAALELVDEHECEWLMFEPDGSIAIGRVRCEGRRAAALGVDAFRRASGQVRGGLLGSASHAAYWQLAPTHAPPAETAAMSARFRNLLGSPDARAHVALRCGGDGEEVRSVLFVPGAYEEAVENTAHDPSDYSVRVRVVGVGTVGMAAVLGAVARGLDPGLVCLVDTDAEAVDKKQGLQRRVVGHRTCRLKGTGGDDEMARGAALESAETLRDLVLHEDLVVIVAGLGGGTGSGIAPLLAEFARDSGALAVAIVADNTMAASPGRSRVAAGALHRLHAAADAVVLADAPALSRLLEQGNRPGSTLSEAVAVLGAATRALVQPVRAPGFLAFDFEEMQAMLRASGWASVGVGWACGTGCATSAVERALSCPTLGPLDQARGAHILMTSAPDAPLSELDDAAHLVCKRVAEDAKVTRQAILDDKLEGIEVTIIATGVRDR